MLKNRTDVFHLYYEMILKKIYFDVVTYITLIYGFGIVGQLKEADGLLKELLLRNINPNVLTFTTLVGGLCKEREIKKAGNMFAVIIKLGVKTHLGSHLTL